MNIKQIKKLFLTSALAMAVLSPAMADVDIAAGANTADCDSDVLKTTTGPANLEANWDANTINLNWYADDTLLTVQTGAQTCTYDGNITLPATQPTKPGYTFDHWIVRQLFDLSTLDTSTNGNGYGYSKLNGGAGAYEDKYGLTPGSGEWATEFSYGTVRGEAICSTTAGNSNGLWNGANYKILEGNIQSNITAGSGDTRYCWCKPTGFDAEKDGSYVGVASPSWVFIGDGSASNCAGDCASRCSSNVQYGSAFRKAIYGVSQ